jgi:hypothetical protein
VYVTPGLNVRITPGVEFLLGVEAPLRDARTFDLGGRIGLIVDF